MRIVSALLLMVVFGGRSSACTAPSRDFVPPRITVQNVVALPAAPASSAFA